jgi:RHS repeat-associated protein
LAGALQQTDLYIGALGEGLNTTISVAATGSTTTTQIVDMNGSVVVTIDIPTSGNATGPTSFQSFDEYGVPETTTITNSTIHNFGWAGTANRQTETTGLILMGARVYNPVTGQFTSPDPIPGGNETTYTYPNDPTNQNDYTGCWPLDVIANVAALGAGIAFSAAAFGIFCATTAGVGCIVALGVAGALGGALSGAVDGMNKKHRGGTLLADIGIGAGVGVISGISGGAAKYLSILRLGTGSGAVAKSLSSMMPRDNVGKVAKVGNWIQSSVTGVMHGGVPGFGLKRYINSHRSDYSKK